MAVLSVYYSAGGRRHAGGTYYLEAEWPNPLNALDPPSPLILGGARRLTSGLNKKFSRQIRSLLGICDLVLSGFFSCRPAGFFRCLSIFQRYGIGCVLLGPMNPVRRAHI